MTSHEHHGIWNHQHWNVCSMAYSGWHQGKHQSSALVVLCDDGQWFPSQRASNRGEAFLCNGIIFPSRGRDNFAYAPSQWEMTLQCNILFHWLGAYAKWSCRGLIMWKYNRVGCNTRGITSICKNKCLWYTLKTKNEIIHIWEILLVRFLLIHWRKYHCACILSQCTHTHSYLEFWKSVDRMGLLFSATNGERFQAHVPSQCW